MRTVVSYIKINFVHFLLTPDKFSFAAISTSKPRQNFVLILKERGFLGAYF